MNPLAGKEKLIYSSGLLLILPSNNLLKGVDTSFIYGIALILKLRFGRSRLKPIRVCLS